MGAREIVIDEEALDRFRDTRWHRTAAGKVTDESGAMAFLREVPVCLAFGGYAVGVPTLWTAACGERDPSFPEHSHHDPAVSLCWLLKDTLVLSGFAYYGRLFLRKPSFVLRAWLPTIIAAYPEQTLSPKARALAEVLRQTGPLPTDELGALAGVTDRKALVAALEEAQGALAVVKVEERYDPFSYIWGTFEHRYAPDLAAAAEIDAVAARRKLVRLWLALLGAVPLRRLATILAWPVELVAETVRPLVESGTLREDVRVAGKPGTALADAAFLAAIRDGRTARAVDEKRASLRTVPKET